MKTESNKRGLAKATPKPKNTTASSSELKALKAQKEELEQCLQEMIALQDELMASKFELEQSKDNTNEIL